MTVRLQRLTCHTSAPFRARAPGPVSGQLSTATGGGADQSRLRFPVAFRPPAFASWASCPARGFRPSYDRPTAPPPAARTRAGFPRSARMRPGWVRASSVPRGRRCRRDRVWCPIAACRFATARPCHPDVALRPGMCLSRGISKDSLVFARPAFPSPVASQTERAALGLSPELPTSRHRMPGRRSR